MPTLKRRIATVLEAAGFSGREDHLPVGGTFEIVAGPAGAEVRVAWWGAGAWEKRKLLERFAVALEEAGFSFEDRGEALYAAAG